MSYKNKTKQEYMKEYRQQSKYTKSAWITKVYGRMKRDNKNKFGISELPFSKDDFIMWIENEYSIKFDKLFSEWVDSGFLKDKVPSVDRIDDYQSYILENMQILTWEENNLKGRNSEKNKNQIREMAKIKFSKIVYKVDMNEEILIESFVSVREAGRQLNIDSSGIAKCCRGEIKSYKGFRWRYE